MSVRSRTSSARSRAPSGACACARDSTTASVHSPVQAVLVSIWRLGSGGAIRPVGLGKVENGRLGVGQTGSNNAGLETSRETAVQKPSGCCVLGRCKPSHHGQPLGACVQDEDVLCGCSAPKKLVCMPRRQRRNVAAANACCFELQLCGHVAICPPARYLWAPAACMLGQAPACCVSMCRGLLCQHFRELRSHTSPHGSRYHLGRICTAQLPCARCYQRLVV
jgi:hypothetical protein